MNNNQLFALLLKLAARNLWLFRLRTTIIGGLLGFGAFLAVFGLSLLKDVESSMRESITGSVVGDIQVHSAIAKDELAVFGGGFMGKSDIGTMNDFSTIRAAAMTVPNVDTFIPMGIDMVFLGRGNELDDTLEALRQGLKSQDKVIIKERIDQLKFQIAQLKLEVAEQRKLVRDQEELNKRADSLAKAEAPGYLDSLQTLDETKLQFLDTQIAPISGEKSPVYLNCLGTDVPLFQSKFPKFKMVEGETIPAGYRGILLSGKIREDFLKIMPARIFDKLNKNIVRSGQTIEGVDANKLLAADLTRQQGLLMAQLDRKEAEELSNELSAYKIVVNQSLPGLIPQLTDQLKRFLKIDDHNFLDRYKWFYEHIGPRVRLYEISPGETITLRAYTRSGYVKSVPLKVFGVYTFSGLEDSDLAGAMNIIDLVSFRELYGQMTEASRKELEEMRANIGIQDVSAENAEDALFGENAKPIEVKTVARAGSKETLVVKPAIADRFEPDELDKGLALNAAIRLKNPNQLKKSMAQLRKVFKEQNMDLNVVDWQKAAGMAGQFVVVVRLALILSLIVIFIVALVIINNSIVVGTLNRTREIGTMRAIGAQKSFVVGLFLAETGLTGLLGAIVGTTVAMILLTWLSHKGIPAGNDVVSFLFSGPRLYPQVRWAIAFVAPVIVTVIAILASIYAARHAAQIQPAEAMQEKE